MRTPRTTATRVTERQTRGKPTLAGDDLVHMDRGSNMWVRVVTFREANLPPGSTEAIREVMSWLWFDYDGIGDIDTATRRRIHAGRHLDALDHDSYVLISPAQARGRLERWANEFGPDDTGAQSPAAVARLSENVHPLFGQGDVYLLTPPAEEHRDDYCVLGWNSDIVDFLVLDRAHDQVHWILATDD